MKMIAVISAIVSILVASLMLCMSVAADTGGERIRLLEEKLRDNYLLLKRERSNLYLTEDGLRPEILLVWSVQRDGPERFERDVIILDLTMDYYEKILDGEDSYDPNELAESIRSLIRESDRYKDWLRGKVEGFRRTITSLEIETASLQE